MERSYFVMFTLELFEEGLYAQDTNSANMVLYPFLKM